MNWKAYERDIEKYFAIRYPNCKISRNVKLPGTLSKRTREIDILIESSLAGYYMSIAVECKKWKTKIDVADVGIFIDKLNDVGINKGIMISTSGYTKAAYERASNHFHTQLQVLNFANLPQKCDFWSIGVRKNLAILLIPPNGWLVDGNVPEEYKMDVIAYMHPFELSLEEAFKKKKIITLQMWPIMDRDFVINEAHGEGFQTAEAIASVFESIGYDLKSELARQDKVVREQYSKSTIEYRTTIVQNREVVHRKIHYVEKEYLEFTVGFEIEDHYVYFYSCVPQSWTEDDKHRLEFVMQNMSFIKLPKDNIEDPLQALRLMNELKDGNDQPTLNVHPNLSKFS